MSVKILHSADFHMDSAFDALPEEKALLRRREQRDMLRRIAEMCNAESVDIVLLSGDLFDSAASYYETQEALISALGAIKARVFISPGNHDYFCPKSPYSYLDFPKNVHIFKLPIISSVEIPELGVRVYGAGFGASRCPSLLDGFRAKDDGFINIMTIHGELSGDMYNHISEEDIALSGLDYLALGHTHAYSGIKREGKTYYAYPGCPEGRGFDELGQKGVIVGTVSIGSVDLDFRPIKGRQYRIFNIDLTDAENMRAKVFSSFPGEDCSDDIVRIILRGAWDEGIDERELQEELAPRFFHVTVRDETHLGRDIWDGLTDDTLTGLFLKRMRMAYDAAQTKEQKEMVTRAVRYGLASLESREEWRP